MLDPQAIDALLARDDHPIEDERAESALLTICAEVRRAGGDEALERLVLQCALAFEADCRAHLPADDPAIRLLDEHHERLRLGLA